MQNASDEGFQLATLVVIVLIVLVVIAYLLIFINPRVALNPFKPPAVTTPTVAIAAISTLPPTWTPAPTDTQVPTVTPTSTSTPTSSPTPSSAPTIAPTATRRPPTRTPAPGAVAPTPIPLVYPYKPILQSCSHSGSATIKGKVSSGGNPIDGVHVELGTSSDPASVQEDQTVRRDANGTTSYAFIIPPPESGSFAWHVWVTDGQNTALSDPNFQLSINTLPADDPGSCWLAVLDFVQ